ncbi:hypothetical protein MDA_GLEAN10001197 [Myotis davidii]|uniref:Uncharacterized protein n=1 Tax=Myotis davidii TaxID=225400 RepID=L5LSQ7_MYODS|nr:hypothetical protein MDA_GLEAN10001197 [Myotis davidii]
MRKLPLIQAEQVSEKAGPTSVADLVALEGLKTTTLHRVALRHTAILLSELSLHIVYIIGRACS